MRAVGEGFSAYILINEADVYKMEKYGETYRYVGEGKGNYTRNATTSLVTVPEYRVYADNVIDDFDIAAGENEDATFVYDEEAEGFVSVATAREAYTAVADEYENFRAYLATNFRSKDGTAVFYEGEKIVYGDTGELYYINVVIRGSISLSQHVAYFTEDEYPEGEALPAQAYALVRGEYVPYDATKHAGLDKYYAYTASSTELGKVLGAIVGELDADFIVDEGYSAVLPFEIRATVKIDYRSSAEDAYDTLYVAGLELAIDLWRTEADNGTLTHVLGLYYLSDVWNIGDNTDVGVGEDQTGKDVVNSAALYVDLSWFFGPSAKVRVDLSQYTVEELLNDKVLSGLQKGDETAPDGSGEAVTAAASNEVVDPDGATVLLNIFSRKIALQASAGFLKLLVGMLAPNTAATLNEVLPNLSIGVDISAAPYDLTIGATLFNDDNVGLLDLGLTLNLFGTSDKTTGMQISFGSLEDYADLSKANFEAKVKEYMFYQSMFSRVDEDDIEAAPEGTVFYMTTEDKEYAVIEGGKAAALAHAKEHAVYVYDDAPTYTLFVSDYARATAPDGERYHLVSNTESTVYVPLLDKAAYDAVAGELNLYRLNYTAPTGDRFSDLGTLSYSAIGTELNASSAGSYIDYLGDGSGKGTALLYVRLNNLRSNGDARTDLLATESGKAVFDKLNIDADCTIEAVDNVVVAASFYVKESGGLYRKTDVFGNYQNILSLDLGTLLNSKGDENLAKDPEHKHEYDAVTHVCECGAVDALALVLEGVQAGGLSSIELGAELSLDLSFRDAINWTRQMTELMRVDGGTQDYFAMMLSSMALNSANFVSAIGMDIKLAVRLKTEGVFEALPSLLAGGNVAAADILPMLRGAMIYLEIALDTNFFGEEIAEAAPIQLWVEVSDDDELYLNIYLIAPDLGTVTGLTGEYGDFFAQGVKLENALSLIDLIPVEAAAKDATDEAVIAAESSSGGIVIDTTGKDVGMVPDNIWGVLDLLLGEVILTHDMLSVGITEDLLGGLIGALVPEFPAEDIKYLPTFKVTGGADSSGIKLLVGDADLTVKVELGIVGGFDDFAPVSEIEAALSNASSSDTLNNLLFGESVYHINKDNLPEFLGEARVIAHEDEDGNVTYTWLEKVERTETVPPTEEGGEETTVSKTVYTDGTNDYALDDPRVSVIISTSEYALAPNASPAEVWLGTRYEFTGIEDGKPVFTDLSYEESYKNGAFESNQNGEYILVPEESDLGSFESVDEDGNKVMVKYAGTYMLAERYIALGGVVNDETTRYALDASQIRGEYVRLGDVNIALELGGLYLSVNQPFSAGIVDSEGKSIYDYRDMLNIAGADEVPGIRLHTEIEVGFWGNEGSGLNLGELIDMLLGIDALKQLLGGVELVGTDLTLDITGDFGSQTEAYFTVALDAYFDFTGNLQAKLTVMRGDVALLGVISTLR